MSDVTARQTLWSLVETWSTRRSNQPCLVYLANQEAAEAPVSLTWGDVATAAWDLRKRLAAIGVADQRTVILAVPNSPFGIVVWLAAASNGAIVQAIDPDTGTLPLQAAIEATNPVAVIAHSGNAAVVGRALAETGSAAVPILADDLSLCSPARSIEGLGAIAAFAPDADPDQIAGLLPTSGTSGAPKLVEMTHRNYVTSGERLARNSAHSHRDRFYLCSPFFHVNAQMYLCMPPLVMGGSIAIVPRFSAGRYFDTARIAGATVSSMVAPPMRMALHRARESGRRIDPGGLRLIQYGMTMSAADWNVWDDMVPSIEMRQVYGQTESVSAVLGGAPWETDDRRTIGRPFLGVDAVKLVDDAGQPIADGTPGELWVRGERGRTLMRGYWRNKEATAAAIDSDGWLRTGDLMTSDGDGRYAFVGRRMHIVRRAGENISTYELEFMMQSCPLIADVAIRAESDPMLGARLVVHVIPTAAFSEQAFVSWCREAIGKRGVPDAIKLHRDFPRTASGRVILRELG
jgi:crotonobetaine/carnitine-CoA ligase